MSKSHGLSTLELVKWLGLLTLITVGSVSADSHKFQHFDQLVNYRMTPWFFLANNFFLVFIFCCISVGWCLIAYIFIPGCHQSLQGKKSLPGLEQSCHWWNFMEAQIASRCEILETHMQYIWTWSRWRYWKLRNI